MDHPLTSARARRCAAYNALGVTLHEQSGAARFWFTHNRGPSAGSSFRPTGFSLQRQLGRARNPGFEHEQPQRRLALGSSSMRSWLRACRRAGRPYSMPLAARPSLTGRASSVETRRSGAVASNLRESGVVVHQRWNCRPSRRRRPGRMNFRTETATGAEAALAVVAAV
jgi:hypothetical protein